MEENTDKTGWRGIDTTLFDFNQTRGGKLFFFKFQLLKFE
jgi:hypothetical protein